RTAAQQDLDHDDVAPSILEPRVRAERAYHTGAGGPGDLDAASVVGQEQPDDLPVPAAFRLATQLLTQAHSDSAPAGIAIDVHRRLADAGVAIAVAVRGQPCPAHDGPCLLGHQQGRRLGVDEPGC